MAHTLPRYYPGVSFLPVLVIATYDIICSIPTLMLANSCSPKWIDKRTHPTLSPHINTNIFTSIIILRIGHDVVKRWDADAPFDPTTWSMKTSWASHGVLDLPNAWEKSKQQYEQPAALVFTAYL